MKTKYTLKIKIPVERKILRASHHSKLQFFIISVMASGAAVLAWFGLYKFIYKQSFSPGLPGEGIFKYVVWKDPSFCKNRVCPKNKPSENKWSSKVSGEWITQDTISLSVLNDNLTKTM